MNEYQINCTCGASWLIWENISDQISIDNNTFQINELTVYTCPKCGRKIEATIGFVKHIKEIIYE